ncbi:MAG TPA: response regulator [Acidothermaceae bacterium]
MSTGRRRTVLLVDDDSDWRDVLAEHLDAAGFSVAVATDGYVAWRSFLESEPLVVVTDVQMPFMDGRELLANVRARNFRVPVIVVTASPAQAQAQARAAELDDAYVVIAKPADPDQIIATVKAAISHRTSHTPLAKIWTVATSLALRNERRPLSAMRSWLWTRRGRAAAVSAIAAVLVVSLVLAVRLRPAHRRLFLLRGTA